MAGFQRSLWRSRMLLRALVIIGLALAASSPALAEKRVALVMGADAYRAVRPLANAVNDARSVEIALERLGFSVVSETDRDLRRMRRALDDFREDAEGADVALVFFAGHGAEIGGENRLLPVDADASSLDAFKRTTLPLEEISAAVGAVGKVGLVVLDACRNDPFGAAATGGRSAVSIAPEVKRRAKPGLGRVGQAKNMLFAFAAAPGETAADGEDGHSPFSEALAKYIGTQGLEFRSVLTLVQQEVYDRSRGHQLPYVESGLPRLFFASQPTEPDALPERERLLLAMADITPDLRTEVEGIATDADMPLAPLYGALLGLGPEKDDPAQRTAKLHEAADAFVKVRADMRTLSSSDPQVSRLRDEAEAQLALGAFDSARARLEEAASIDSESRNALKGRFVERTLSEAATRSISAGASRADLRYPLAIADYRKAAALYAEVEDSEIPAGDVEKHWLALQAIGDISVTMGDLNSAASAYRDLTAAIDRRLEKHPDTLDWQRDLAVAHSKRGNVLVTQGDLSAALKAYDRSRDILTAVAAADPGTLGWQGDLAMAHNKRGNVLADMGRLDTALAAYGEALKLRQKLVARQPDNTEWQRDLTISLDEIGDVLGKAGEYDAALDVYQRSSAIRAKLALVDPNDTELKRDLWVSLERVGNIHRMKDEPDAALAAYREALAVMEPLAASDPGNTQWQRDLSVNQERIGVILRDTRDFDGALAAFRANLEASEKFAAADPSNMEWQRDVSVSLEKVADVLRSKKDFKGALKLFQRSLAISERLAASDPSNMDWRRDLAISYSEVGDVLSRLDDFDGADEALNRSLEIRLELAASDPDNAEWQRDLIVSYLWLADAGSEPRKNLTMALEVATRLEERGRLAPKDAFIPGYLRDRLAKLKAPRKKK